jgi:hypothetical protein
MRGEVPIPVILQKPPRICQLCGVAVISTLEHRLPQSQFADCIVAQINIVPACADFRRIVALISRKWARESAYRLIKKLWAFHGNRLL